MNQIYMRLQEIFSNSILKQAKRTNAKIRAFTLIEILVVMAIMTFVLLLNYSIGLSLSRGFISTSATKAMLEFLRTTKQLAVLNSESANEHLLGMGVLLTKNSSGGYEVQRYKYTTGNFFQTNKEYVDPSNYRTQKFVKMPKDTYNFINVPLQVGVKFYVNDNTNPVCDNMLIIFEALFGKPHAYCVQGVDSGTLGTDLLSTNSKLRIEFESTQSKIIINSNAEIYGSFR